MRSRDITMRAKRFAVSEKARKVEGLERMIREFQQMVSDLDRQVQAEEERTGVRDRAHYAYSTFAKAAGQRRDNLVTSIADLTVKLDDAVRERDAAKADFESTLSPTTEGGERRAVERGTPMIMR